MLLLHISDLHLSRYGEHRTWLDANDDPSTWAELHNWKRWTIQGRRDKKNRPERMRLVDPGGVVHIDRKWPQKGDDKAVSTLLALAMERHRHSSDKLMYNRPTTEDLTALLKVDSTNTNLRFLQLVDHIEHLSPEIILLTGDMTDNGFGYDLIEHYLARWVQRKALFVIPGNHDTYDMFPRKGRKARLKKKEERYLQFAKHCNSEPNNTGAYVRRYGDLAIVGLSSCKPPRTLLSASGAVSREQLVWLEELGHDAAFREAQFRFCLVHHHLLRMPFELGKRQPIELAMRMRNAPEVMRCCAESKIDYIFHGHRHHGYMVHLPGHPMVISSPSSTKGCKSTGTRYVWTLDITERNPTPRFHHFVDDRADADENGFGAVATTENS